MRGEPPKDSTKHIVVDIGVVEDEYIVVGSIVIKIKTKSKRRTIVDRRGEVTETILDRLY